jgi:hypothetical protein
MKACNWRGDGSKYFVFNVCSGLGQQQQCSLVFLQLLLESNQFVAYFKVVPFSNIPKP